MQNCKLSLKLRAHDVINCRLQVRKPKVPTVHKCKQFSVTLYCKFPVYETLVTGFKLTAQQEQKEKP